MQCWSMEPSGEEVVHVLGDTCSPSPVKLTLYWHEEKRRITIQHPAQFDVAVIYIEK